MRGTVLLSVLLLPVFAAAQVAPPAKPAPAAPTSPWVTDYELAWSRARNEKRDLLMVFMAPAADGSDQKLEQEILARPEFATEAGKLFVLARFDYPRDESKVPEVQRRQNAQLLAKYRAPRLPVVWLADATGRAYARSGYLPGGAGVYVTMLADKQKAQQKAAAALARAATLRGLDRAKALAEGLRCLDDAIVATTHYSEMLEIIQLDADGAAGLQPEFDAIARDAAASTFLVRMQDELGALAAAQKWEELDKRIAAAREQHAGERWAQQYLTFLDGVRKADGEHDHAAALALFTSALQLAPRSEVAPQIELRRQQAEAAEKVERQRQDAAAKQPVKKGKKD
ncbi:MAG TPA: hypothetical protein VFZ65_12110 [Planctomycetota bacterium]|nr:hypothetical protein [Planctomycetota bacterium]